MDALLALLQHRWNVPVLAELHAAQGAKFVTLANRLGLSRASLSTSLKYLMEQDLVRRNPGYGHPLRPEYLLTAKGKTLAPRCHHLMTFLTTGEETQLAFRKWSLPLVAVTGGADGLRFSQLSGKLGVATPRALTLGLKALQRQCWLDRQIVAGYPPTASYRLRARGIEIWQVLRPLYQRLPTANCH